MVAKAPESGVEKRLRDLEQRLARAEVRVAELEARVAGPVAPTFQPVYEPVAAPFSPQPAPPTAARSGPDLERLIGVNWLSKVGMVVLVLGVVFFLRYAFDQGWITIPMRVVLGVVGGLSLAVLGDVMRWRDRQRFDAYGQVLSGGGAAIAYFSLFASYEFPEYRAALGMRLELAASLMGLTAVLLALYSAIRRTRVLAMEAVSMGVLASIYGAAFTGFSVVYVLLLVGAVLAAALWRDWPDVVGMAALTGFLDLFVLHAAHVDAWHVGFGGVAMLLLFVPVVLRLRGPPGTEQVVALMAGGTLFAAWGVAMVSVLRSDYLGPYGGPVTIGFAVAALALALQPYAAREKRWGWATAFIALALWWPPIELDGVWTPVAWSLLAGAGAALLAVRRILAARLAVVAAGALALVHLAIQETPKLNADEIEPLMGLLPFALLVGSMLSAWTLVGFGRSREDPVERVMLGIGLAAPLFYTGATLDGFAISIAWAVEAVMLIVAGFAARVRDLRVGGLALLALVLGRIFLVDLIVLDVAVRIITFLVVGGLLLLASFLYARRQRPAVSPQVPVAPLLPRGPS